MDRKPKTFSTVREFLEAYFPDDKRLKAPIENYEESGVAWALKMAKKYHPKHKPPQ